MSEEQTSTPLAIQYAEALEERPIGKHDVWIAEELRRLAAVEKKAAEVAQHFQQQIDRLRSERDALRARLDGATKAAEEVFGQKAIRYKFSLNKRGRPYVSLPPEMDGRWYALQPAEDDAHIGLCDEIVRLRSELEAARGKVGAQEWQPIETAPKDGTEFDAWNGRDRVPNVFWAVPEYATDGESTWCTWEYITGFGHEAHTAHCLTHWRPLPPAPHP